MRTIQSQYIPIGQGHLGGGTKVLAEDFIGLPNVKYALIETIEHKYKFSPAGIKTVREYRIGRFEFIDGLWEETSWYFIKTKRDAVKGYKSTINSFKVEVTTNG